MEHVFREWNTEGCSGGKAEEHQLPLGDPGRSSEKVTSENPTEEKEKPSELKS